MAIVEGRSITIQKNKALSDSIFSKLSRAKGETWLKDHKKDKGIEMDSAFFHSDRFELIIDVRGYQPEDLKCIVNPNSVDVAAVRQDIQTGASRNISTSRHYDITQTIRPEQAICYITNEGILLVSVPWRK